MLRAARRDRPRRVAVEETRATDAAAAELSAKDIKTLVCWSGETRRMCRAGDEVCLPRAWSDESAKTTGGQELMKARVPYPLPRRRKEKTSPKILLRNQPPATAVVDAASLKRF